MITRKGCGRIGAGVLALVLAMAVLVPGAAPPASGLSIVPEQAWIAETYRKLLDRDPTAAQMAHREGQLRSGVGRRAIADQLTASAEHAGVVVDRLYRRILGRGVDATSRAYWVGRLTRGERVSTIASFIYGSPELYARGGGTPEGYVTFLYRDLLGREPDAAGLDYWADRVAAGHNRTALARAWYLSPEATGLQAGLVYLHLLERPPSAGERADWAARLRRLDVRQVTAAIVSSEEALALWPGAPTLLTLGAAPSDQASISADGRIVAFTSRAWDLTPVASPPGDDVFVFDLRTGRMRAITAGNKPSTEVQVSADGSTVVFQSAATNLVAGDTNGKVDVFRAATTGGAIERLTAGDGDSTEPRTSGDGSIVAFTSVATNLVAGDPNGATADVYVHTDGVAGLARLGGDGSGDEARSPDVSADGGTLVFEGTGAGFAPDLPPAIAEYPQAYLVDLPLAAEPGVVRLSTTVGREPTVAADGRTAAYTHLDPAGGGQLTHPVIATVTGDAVTGRVSPRTGHFRSRDPRISDDGSAVLSNGIYQAGSSSGIVLDSVAFADDGDPVGPLGIDGDLTADAAVAATSWVRPGKVPQIGLFDVAGAATGGGWADPVYWYLFV